ncbi:MAG TPA: class I SAM-dependent methyltransferase [Gemmataceae bacterium]|nr:class I SAM-dependent methyltransferase [Gemmataceae bacterium]
MAFFPRDVAAPVPVPHSPVRWEETACILCGRRHWRQLVEAPDARAGAAGRWFAVVQCLECGCTFTNPRPNIESIGQFYQLDYEPHRTPRRIKARWHRFGLPGRASRRLPWRGPGRLLDVGCGNGSFLEQAHAQGWEVTGVDMVVPTEVMRRAGNRYPILLGSLPHPDLEAASFDVVTMWQSLEHVHDPLTLLHEVRRLLLPGGKLLVTVPNIDGASSRWFGAAWVGLDLPRHLTHFSPATLHRLLQRAGFHVGPVGMVRHPAWIRASAQLARQRFGGAWWHSLLRTRFGSGLAAWYAYLTFQSDCLLVTAERQPERGFL